MDNKTITQPEVEDTQKEETTVVTPTTSTEKVENKKEDKTYSQEEVNSQMKKTRLASEREAKKQLLAQLGLTLEDEDKLDAFKQAYQNSLSDEEKRNAELETLKADKQKLADEVEEKDYVIKALIALTGKNEEDVDKIVKMAKGLKTEDNTIEDAINDVISMINVPKENTTPVVTNPNVPQGQELSQPSTTVDISTDDNPFMPGSINLTKQGQLLRTNPELAKKLAAEAGTKLNF